MSDGNQGQFCLERKASKIPAISCIPYTLKGYMSIHTGGIMIGDIY